MNRIHHVLSILLWLGSCGAINSASTGTIVFENDMAGISCYRIPSVVKTERGTLIAFAEARHGSCGDGEVHELAFRRSFDDGASWSNVSFAVGNASYMVGNPSAVATKTGKIVVAFVKHAPGCVGDCGTGNAVIVSSDEGATWSPPRDISEMLGPASGSMPGPGTALQSDSGRILIISHHGAYAEDFVSFSDDDGETWETSNVSLPHMDEAQLTQLSNGSVLANMRHASASKLGRAIAISNDDGLSFSPIEYDAALISPICQASIVTFNGCTYFSNPASTKGRDHITIRRSTDNTATWHKSTFLVEPGSSFGYSCLVRGALSSDETKGGILYEAPGSTIRFEKFPLNF